MEVDDALPGSDLIRQGLRDLAAGTESIESLLVLVGAPRLRRLGFDVPGRHAVPSRGSTLRKARGGRLRYRALALQRADPKVGQFRTGGGMREPVDEARLREFMSAIAAEAREPGRIYLAGGASAVLEHWRENTVDIDITIIPESDRILRAIPELKERFHVNVELRRPRTSCRRCEAGKNAARSSPAKASSLSTTSISTHRRFRSSIADMKRISSMSMRWSATSCRAERLASTLRRGR